MSDIMDMLGFAGDVLDTPGSVVRGLLGGDPGRAFGGIFDPSQRMSGREMLGLEEGTGNELLGLGASVLTDPLMLLGGLGGASMLRRGRATAEAAGAVRGMETAPLAQAVLGTTARSAEEVAPLARMILGGEPLAQETAPLAKAIVEGPAAPFYSRLDQAAAKMPGSVKGESLMNTLAKQGGFSQEEAQFRNMGELATPGTRVSKEDLLKHLDENKIGVQEVWKGGGAAPEFELNDSFAAGGTKFEQYQTPGGDNYRELLLTLPNEQAAATKSATKAQAKSLADEMRAQGLAPGDQEWHRRFGELNDSVAPAEFKSGHWDEPNILAHVRMQDRVGSKGEKILHIEEVQSDWHQAGKKSGYRPANTDELNQRLAVLEDEYANLHKKANDMSRQELAVMRDKQSSEIMSIQKQLGAVPDAPFKDTWHELAMKRMIRLASEEGYDKITWNPGHAIQAQVGGELAGQQKFYDEVLPNWMNKYAKKWGVKVEPSSDANLPHGIPITPSMRQDVMSKGQPLMALPPALLAAILGSQQS